MIYDKPFNLEVIYGPLLELMVKHISEMSPEMPPEEVEHSGVKGMKWGVRKDDSSKSTKSISRELHMLGPDKVVRKTPSGEEITLSKNPTTALHKAIARVSPKYVEHYNSGAVITIKDGSGKRVGDASFGDKGNGELYLNWLGIDQSARGKGYATQAMKAAEEFGKQSGFKKMTLEVPGNAPDAQHIYEKLGFKVTGKHEEYDPDDSWGGLTNMEYKFDMKHELSPEACEYFAHAGVKGMKWGRRKKVDPSDNVERKSNTGRNIKIIGGVVAGVAVAAGAAYAVNALNKRGNVSVSSVASSPATAAGRNLLDLTLNPRPATSAPSAGLNIGTPSRSGSPGGLSGGPSLSSLNNILANTPRVSFDSSTGQYRTG